MRDSKSAGFPAGLVLLVLGPWLWLGSTGCAGLRVADQLDRRLQNEEFNAGLEDIEKAKSQYAGPNSLLYYFDKGSLEQRAALYTASNADLEEGEKLIENLQVASVSESVASFLVNDTTLSYSGEDFEQVMVNVLKTINYLCLGDLNGAQIEARKVNTRLLALSDKYGQEAVYKEDAFARYLSAFAYEAAGEYNDAYLDYKSAYRDFQWYAKHFDIEVPPLISADLLRLSHWLGFDDEYESWQHEFGTDGVEPGRRPQKQSEVLLVVFDGLMPRKQTRFVEAPVLDPDHRGYMLKVAFPVIKPRNPALQAVRVQAEDGSTADGYVVEPLQEIAIANLNQRIGLITVKAIARAVAKYTAAVQLRRATRTQDQGLNLLVDVASNIYTFATEQADTRCWRSLPNRFGLIRLPLSPGVHQLNVQLEAFGGGFLPNRTLTVELKKGEKKVLPLYVAQ
ncbi:MAG: hypothetical protein HGA76_07045 [Candidatus Firestonebacteria bacterium]|nr:hypothetical protein [Candidatus Firestonebacteria bacterium]